MGFTTDLITGIGKYLQAHGVGKWDTPYATSDIPLAAYALPATPDRAVSITPYPVSDSGGTDSITAIQFRARGTAGNRMNAADVMDAIFDQLHDVEHVTIGGICIVRIWRQSQAYLGTDGNNRQEHTANYYIQLTRTGTHRED